MAGLSLRRRVSCPLGVCDLLVQRPADRKRRRLHGRGRPIRVQHPAHRSAAPSPLEERRQHPQNDLVSELLAAEVDGQGLSNMELLGFCGLLLVAGNETTTNLLGNMILCFDENPGVIERLRANRALVPGAIEESLRYYSPVKAMPRITTSETMLGDQCIEPGQVIVAWIGSANRDEGEFPDS